MKFNYALTSAEKDSDSLGLAGVGVPLTRQMSVKLVMAVVTPNPFILYLQAVLSIVGLES